MLKIIEKYRYEFLLFALLQLVFNKIFFTSEQIYLQYVWPLNMVLISVANYFIFKEKSRRKKNIRNILGIISLLMPFAFVFLNKNMYFYYVLTFFFIIYYIYIFWEVMYQITLTKEVRLNIVIGSFCGYLLLHMIALFSYIAIELLIPNSFLNVSNHEMAKMYNELNYFSLITLTSIGFGDILPSSNTSRLTVSFFGIAGQFYMVAVVGIIISKFTSK